MAYLTCGVCSFIVLEHDLFQQTVDIAVGYTLNLALNYTPQLTLEPIGVCQGWPASNLYLETTTNTTFPYPDSDISTEVSTTNSARATAISEAAQASGSSSKSSGAHERFSMPGMSLLLAGLSVLAGGLLVA